MPQFTRNLKIVVGNETQKALLENELLGQLSDGYWEGAIAAERKHYVEGLGYVPVWRMWSEAEIIVAKPGERVGVNFPTVAFNFTAAPLLDVVLGRMVTMVQETVDPTANAKTVRKDLSFLKRHVAKNWVS